MPIPSTMADLSTIAASNSPSGSDNPITADDHIRALAGIVRTTNAKGADIASASSIDLGAATGEFVDITGTTTITSLGTVSAGIVRAVRFTGVLTLTHNATSLILPSSANITTANGDVAEFRSLGSGNWKCVNYIRQSGVALVSPNLSSYVTLTDAQTLTNKTLTSPVITAPTTTVATDDKVILLDTSNSDATRTVTAQDIADLAEAIVLNSSVATTSGTSVTVSSSIPSTAKRFKVKLSSVSTTGSSDLLVQVVVSGTPVTVGYIGGSGNESGSTATNWSTGVRLISNSASVAFYGHIEFERFEPSSTVWTVDVRLGRSDSNTTQNGAGQVDAGGTVTGILITTVSGSPTFDSGSASVSWE